MRVEVNISLASSDARAFGTKVEVKNLNSFRAVSQAIAYEIARQAEVLERGNGVVQETRGWDEQKQATVSQRSKENAHDYRYFPDPDIPKFCLSDIAGYAPARIRASLPELPWEVRARLRALHVPDEATELLVADSRLCTLFFAAQQALSGSSESVRLLVNYITSDLIGLRNKYENIEISTIRPTHLAEIISLYQDSSVSSRGAKELLEHIARHPAENSAVRDIAEQRGLLQVSDVAALERIVDAVLKEHAAVAEEYKKGKESTLGFLVGQCMRASRGAGNPQLMQDLLRKKMS